MTPAAIVVEQLRKSYQVGEHQVDALRGIDVSIERGTFVSIMGASGSGKSTFLHILGCLDSPTSGRYLLEGVDVSLMSRAQLAEIRQQRLGFVFQHFHLSPRMSALENIELPLFYSKTKRCIRQSRARAALRMVGLEARAAHHPQQLSGGQQQRVAIARALVQQPTIILADEPTGNLDSHTSLDIMGLLQALHLQRGITIILVTHEPEIAHYAQRVIMFKDGRVLQDAPVLDRTLAPAIHSEPVMAEAQEDAQ